MRAVGLPGERGRENFGNQPGIPVPARAGGGEWMPMLEMGFPGLPLPDFEELPGAATPLPRILVWAKSDHRILEWFGLETP